MISDDELSKICLTLPYDRLLPFPPVTTKDICLCWLLKVISPHNQLPSILLNTFIKSPQMLNFSHGKGNTGIRNVIPEREFSPEISNIDVSTRKGMNCCNLVMMILLVSLCVGPHYVVTLR